MRHIRLFAVILMTSALQVANVDGQTAQRFSVQGSGLYVGLAGEAYELAQSGMGLEGQLRFNPTALSIGLGAQFSEHRFGDPETQQLLRNQTIKLIGPFIEPRYVLPVPSDRLAPYVSARVAYLRQSFSSNAQDGSISLQADGVQINGGGGVLIRIASVVNLDAGLSLGYVRFGNYEINASGPGGQFSDSGATGSGTNIVFRLGLAIGIGG